MNSGSLLDKINSPDNLKDLSFDELNRLCSEIRKKLITTVSETGGHLASNLGVVELTVALHKSFDSPNDQIVWDVGHQCYTHKLLTGRREQFNTLRQFHGMSGFTKPDESPHDPYGAGHSSTSISAACGLAKAKSLAKDDGYVVAVIGDGALTGGLAYEGINNAGRSHDNIIIVLNDNRMSISKNVGAMARHLAVIRLKPWYFKVKDFVEHIIVHTPLIGDRIRNALAMSKSAIKNILYHSTVFEEMGLIYLGPADGHNIEDMCNLFERAKNLKRPVLIHVMTVKGKGYCFAENDPRSFHGVSKFDIETGDPVEPLCSNTFSQEFGHAICSLAEDDERICAITAAMAQGTGLQEFAKKYFNRFFDVGIAEEHAVVFACGLACNGMLPVFAVYSSFLQRAYDQILHDAALQKLKVIFAIDRAGLTGPDGETHQGIFDAAFLNTVPGITVYSPSTINELKNFLCAAFYECDGPVALRYPRGKQGYIPENFHPSFGNYDLYVPSGNHGGTDILLVTYGRLFSEVAKAALFLTKSRYNVCILKINRIKPIDTACFEMAKYYEKIFFFEEGIKAGGIGESFGIGLLEHGFHGKLKIFAIENRFVQQGTVPELLSLLGLDADNIKRTVIRECE